MRITWVPGVEENDDWFVVEVSDDVSPSPQCNGNVGVVFPNGKVGRNGDTQPQLGSAFGVSLSLKLAKPVTRAEDGHKRQRHAVGAGDLC